MFKAEFLLLACLASLTVVAGQASAQSAPIVLGGKLQIDGDQRIMLDAMRHTMAHDYKSSEALYGTVLSNNPNNIDAYLQRGMVRREMNDANGAASDGKMAAAIANQLLQSNRNNANLYYQRGMGFRLSGNYDQAEKDVRTAINLGGAQANWETDLKAIQFERQAAVR